MHIRDRVLSIMHAVVPDCRGSRHDDDALQELGFASMDLIALFVELEQEFGLSVELMEAHLRKRCTVGSLVELCCAA